jgi:hypothetical protein
MQKLWVNLTAALLDRQWMEFELISIQLLIPHVSLRDPAISPS